MTQLNKIIQKEDLLSYLTEDCVIHVISKYGKQDYANYINLTKLLKESIIIVQCEENDLEEESESLVDELFNINEDSNDSSDGNVTKRKKIDRGKIIALHNAGWSGRKIADEMRCSIGTVYNVIKLNSKIKQLNK